MAVQLRVRIVGSKALTKALDKMNPGINKKILRDSLIEAALGIQKDAAGNQILRGGGGKRNARPAVAGRLTSRTGTLRRSIKVDRGPLPFAIEAGTDLVYGAVHEFGLGGRQRRPFMKPALDKVAPKFGDIVVKHWKRAVRR